MLNTVQTLRAGEPRRRAVAVQLPDALTADATELVKALRARDSFVREAAAKAMSTTGHAVSPAVLQQLLAATADPSPYVYVAAIRSLAQLRTTAAVPSLLRCLQSPHVTVLHATIEALAQLGASEAGALLLPLLHSANARTRCLTVRALGKLGYAPAGQAILALLQAHPHQRERDGFRLLLAYIEGVAVLQVKAAILILMDIAQHEGGFRAVAFQALLDLQANLSSSFLTQLFASAGVKLRDRLVKLIVRADYRPALPVLRPLLADEASAVRRGALTAVTRWQDHASAPQVRWMCVHEPHIDIRLQAIHGLVALLGDKALSDLLALARDAAEPAVRRAARTYLKQFDHKGYGLDSGVVGHPLERQN